MRKVWLIYKGAHVVGNKSSEKCPVCPIRWVKLLLNLNLVPRQMGQMSPV